MGCVPHFCHTSFSGSQQSHQGSPTLVASTGLPARYSAILFSSDFCANAVCPANTDPNNATWTDCCTFAGRSVQCCRPG